MASLPGAVAVDRPLKLGSTFLGHGADDEGYYTLKMDFQPESLQQAEHADLLLLGADQVGLLSSKATRMLKKPQDGTLTSLLIAHGNGTVILTATLSLLPLQLKLIPLLPDGDGFHFEGTLEQLHQRPGSDLQCVAYFDGNEWTLQVVHAQLHTK